VTTSRGRTLKKRLITWTAVAICSTAALLSGLAPRHEPRYSGKTLTYWLKRYESTITSGELSDAGLPRQEARNAVLAIGTNGIPVLLDMLRARDSKFAAITHRVLHLLKLNSDTAGEKNILASDAFQVLGPAAKDAVPALAEIFVENVSRTSQMCTAAALKSIGPPFACAALPAVLRQTSDPDPGARERAVHALRSLNCADPSKEQALIKALHDSDAAVRLDAIGGLGTCNSKTSAQILLQYTASTDIKTRRQATAVLGGITPPPEGAIGALTTNLADKDQLVRRFSAYGLGHYGPFATSAIPALRQLLSDDAAQVRVAATSALQQIKGEAPPRKERTEPRNG
jgi:HEAT repeat protein